jgi:hypothetical protein
MSGIGSRWKKENDQEELGQYQGVKDTGNESRKGEVDETEIDREITRRWMLENTALGFTSCPQ